MTKKKEPLQLKPDELEVGLDRYRKDKRRPPGWAFDFGPWIVVGGCVLVVVMSMLFWRRKAEQDPNVLAQSAALSVGVPMKVWAEGSTTQLKSVKVSVANTGAGAAADVVVVASLRGRQYTLSGASRIESGTSEIFAGSVEGTLKPGDEVSIVASCGNCP
jgi:hypothetical protein